MNISPCELPSFAISHWVEAMGPANRLYQIAKRSFIKSDQVHQSSPPFSLSLSLTYTERHKNLFIQGVHEISKSEISILYNSTLKYLLLYQGIHTRFAYDVNSKGETIFISPVINTSWVMLWLRMHENKRKTFLQKKKNRSAESFILTICLPSYRLLI